VVVVTDLEEVQLQVLVDPVPVVVDLVVAGPLVLVQNLPFNV
jgi:hypothetical protein